MKIDIHKFLPHRDPILLVDAILDIGSDFVITAFRIRGTHIFVEDGKLQETGLVENIAQTCSSVLGQSFFEDDNSETKKVMGFITGIKKLKFIHCQKLARP